ncbi:MAG: hypothetical protein MZW92_46685 [Comamonadaceae bacterium]|nr:hypothetical protein [Comamonadaceae bacterium]
MRSTWKPSARCGRPQAMPRQWIDIALPQPEAHDKPQRAPFLAARRQLFRRFVGRAADALAQAGDPVEAQPIPDRAIRAGAPLLTEQRELLQIVGKTADGAPFVVASHEALPLLDLELAPGCTACEACFRVCPTGALLVEEDSVELGAELRRRPLRRLRGLSGGVPAGRPAADGDGRCCAESHPRRTAPPGQAALRALRPLLHLARAARNLRSLHRRRGRFRGDLRLD